MKWIFLIATILAGSMQMVFNKQFGNHKKKSAITYAAMQVFSAMTFFFVTAGSYTVTPTQLGFSAAFAVVYGTAVFCSLNALRNGSMAKTSLVSSLSLMLPTLYGILFLRESVSVFLIPGLLSLVLALVCVNRRKNDVSGNRIWVLFAVILFVSNGMCSIVQKSEGMACPSASGGMFMATALAMVFVVFTITALMTEKTAVIVDTVKTNWYRAVIAGMLNGLLNFLVLKLNPLFPASFLFPAISAGGVVLNRILSELLFQEKFDRVQNIGFLFGILTIILLNL